MKTWNRRFVVVGLVVALTVGAGCTSSESPVGPSTAAPTQAPELLLGGLGSTLGSTVGKVLSVTDLLTCRALPYASTTRTVGPNGGVVAVGQYSLVIPAGALKSNVQIMAEQVSGKVNSVRFSPEGLQFSKTATVELSYRNCSLLLGVLKRVAYTDEKLKILDLIPSLDLLNLQTVRGSIKHFSRYAVAW